MIVACHTFDGLPFERLTFEVGRLIEFAVQSTRALVTPDGDFSQRLAA